MKISLIAAMDKNRVIGHNKGLPWHLPADLLWFRKNTLGKPIVMGRRTFESIGRPLPGRTNIVLTRDEMFEAEGCIVEYNIEDALRAAENVIGDNNDAEVIFIGGGQLFRQMIWRADRIYLTRIEAEFEGDTLFPEIRVADWTIVWQEELRQSEGNPFNMRFMILERSTAEDKHH